jgi:crossover junction endodeoxyribonuclease RuvC
MRILGVDPGSRLTGYGCVDMLGNHLRHVTHGTLKVSDSRKVTPFEDRILAIYEGLSQVILQFKPQIMVVEKVFFSKNALSALKLGQARGAVILTGKLHSMSICEYSPNEVKLAVVGNGHADKIQVARMVSILTGQQKFPTFDASDGLALAICHAQSLRTNSFTKKVDTLSLSAAVVKRSKKRLSLAEHLGIGLKKKD